MKDFRPYGTSAIFEAMCYFARKVNGSTIAARVKEMEESLPSRATAIRAAAQRALAIETALDERLNTSDEAYRALFTNYMNKGRNPVTHTAAFMLTGSLIMENPWITADELKTAALACDDEMRMLGLTLFQSNVFVRFDAPDSHGVFMRRVDLANLSPEGKWACMDCYLHYEERIDELIELLRKGARAYDAVIADIESKPDYGQPLESTEQYLAALNEAVAVQLDPNTDMVACGSDMLFDAFMFSVVTHKNDGRPDLWEQTGVITGFNLFRMKHMEQETGGIDMAEGLRAISDPSRMEILRILAERSVYGKELCELLGLTPGTVSKHITKLINAGLVDCRIDSIRAYYSLNKENAYSLIKLLDKSILNGWRP